MWNKRYIAALFAALALLAGCQKAEEELIKEEPEVVPEQPSGSYTLTLEATKGVDTKALSLDGSTLNAHWVTGETVAVYLGGAYKGLLTATAHGSDATRATLSGTLDNVDGVVADAELTLLFPRALWDYTGQDGSAPSEAGSLATKYDYATATVTVASVSGSEVTTTGGASFANEQSMYRFGFKAGGAGDQIPVKGFTVSSIHNTLVRSRSWDGTAWAETFGPIAVEVAGEALNLPYASLRNTRVGSGNGDSYSFSVIGSDNALYLGGKDIPSSVMTTQGRFISAKSISVTRSNLARSGTATEAW